jgi:hypothetical protein
VAALEKAESPDDPWLEFVVIYRKACWSGPTWRRRGNEEKSKEWRGDLYSGGEKKNPIRNNVSDKTDLATGVVFTRSYKSRTCPMWRETNQFVRLGIRVWNLTSPALLDETVACCLDSPRGARPMAPS